MSRLPARREKGQPDGVDELDESALVESPGEEQFVPNEHERQRLNPRRKRVRGDVSSHSRCIQDRRE